MKIKYQNKIITSKDISSSETAWKIKDAFAVIDYYYSLGQIILGGDILSSNLQYTYDNWYYDIDSAAEKITNLKNSIYIAKEYILNYTKRNGLKYYVVFVLQ